MASAAFAAAAAVGVERVGVGGGVDPALEPVEQPWRFHHELLPRGTAPATPLFVGECVAAGVVPFAEATAVTPPSACHRHLLPRASASWWCRAWRVSASA